MDIAVKADYRRAKRNNDNPNFANECNASRFPRELRDMFVEVFKTKTATEWDKILTENGIEYTEEYFTLQNGQPLRSLEDAVAFFKMYDRKGADITVDSVRPALIPDPKGEYAWYYPMESRFRLIAFEMN